MEIGINEHEKALLQDVLERYLSELRTEISKTDDHDYRAILKKRKESLDKILTTLH